MEITELFGLMNFRTSQIRYFILYFNYIFRDQKWVFARSDTSSTFNLMLPLAHNHSGM